MRFTKIVMLLGVSGLLAAASMSPEKLLSQTLAAQNGGMPPFAHSSPEMVSLKEALADLGKAYQVDILYADDLLQGKTGLKLSSVSNNLNDDLNQVLADNPLAYAKVGNRTIVIMPREAVAAPNPPAGGTIKGKVTDEKGEAIPFAQAILDGTTIGAATDQNGEYEIKNVPPGTYTLRVRIIGYRQKTAPVTVAEGATVTQDFMLAEDLLMMGEVVVTGTRTP
ncbi:MAG: carboxypeptidase-like regulatory domain-containing protein, partial [bacterium]